MNNHMRYHAPLPTAIRYAAAAFAVLIGAIALSACNGSGGTRYIEPTVIGRIVDFETKKPIQGAFIYGHYATSSGKLAGGRKFGEEVKSFLVQTDANGMFRIEGWKSEQPISGEASAHSPALAVYKPGYKIVLHSYRTIRQWEPATSAVGDAYKRADHDDPIDWTNYPFELKPVTTEAERYSSLQWSDNTVMFMDECGWEVYAPLLLAQHNELKSWYKRNWPSDNLLKSGYPMGTNTPSHLRETAIVHESFVDQLIRTQPTASTCASAQSVFTSRK
jgi:hypothetical protein